MATRERPSREDGAPAHADDHELVRSALRGSRAARRAFAERMRVVPKILLAKNARLGRPLSDEDLEDVVQETVLTIWKRLDSYEGRAALETWAYRFCHLVLLRHLRGLDRRMAGAVNDLEEPAGTGRHSAADFEELYVALAKIPSESASLLHLRHFEHLSFEDIGKRLGLPTSTVKTHYRRAAARVREIIEPRREEAS